MFCYSESRSGRMVSRFGRSAFICYLSPLNNKVSVLDLRFWQYSCLDPGGGNLSLASWPQLAQIVLVLQGAVGSRPLAVRGASGEAGARVAWVVRGLSAASVKGGLWPWCCEQLCQPTVPVQNGVWATRLPKASCVWMGGLWWKRQLLLLLLLLARSA